MPLSNHQIFPQAGGVTAVDRAAVVGQEPLTIWLTGLSASGKSTLAYALEKSLIDDEKACFVLDGDNVRQGLNKDLGFSSIDRSENIRRIAEVAKLMNEAGLIVITAFISPFAADRALAKKIIGSERFLEVHLSAPINVCEQRDPKGLYKRARLGMLADFTGISQAYEVPSAPDMVIDTSSMGINQALLMLRKRFMV